MAARCISPCAAKKRKKRHTGRARRGSIPNQVSIDLRPAVMAEHARFGDWEADLVIGAGQKQALVTINERTSRYSLIAHVPFKTAKALSGAMIAMHRLNHRPRKCLGYRTPQEVFMEQLQLHYQPVALQT
jgi:IS30 family transposase